MRAPWRHSEAQLQPAIDAPRAQPAAALAERMEKNKGQASGSGSGEGSGAGDGNPRPVWWELWRTHVRQLRAALLSAASEQEIRDLLAACLQEYLGQLGEVSPEDVMAIVSGQRHSPLEAAFMWLGGWRPTSAIVLVYSLMGLQINEDTQQAVLEQVSMSVPLLSDRQLSRINALQLHSRRAEADLSDRLAMIQMFVTDDDLVSALDLGASSSSTTGQNMPQAKEVVDSKLRGISDLLAEADQLRLHTLQELYALLSPVQGARCCLAAYELVFALKTLSHSSFAELPVPVVPTEPATIPVPVPVLASDASTSRQGFVASLPLLLPLEPDDPSLSIPVLSPVPIPLIIPTPEFEKLPSPIRHLRTEASFSEAELLADAMAVFHQQGHPECSPPAETLACPQELETQPGAQVPVEVELSASFQEIPSEPSPSASDCDSLVLTASSSTRTSSSEATPMLEFSLDGLNYQQSQHPNMVEHRDLIFNHSAQEYPDTILVADESETAGHVAKAAGAWQL